MSTKTKKLESYNKKDLIKEITTLRKEYEKLQKCCSKDKKLAKKIAEIKSEFISVTSHQLRTPMSAIKWDVEVLLSEDFGNINQKQRNFLIQIDSNNNRILSILDDLLRVSDIDKGKVKIEKQKVNFNELLDEIITDSEIDIKLKKIKVYIKSKKKKGYTLLLDEDKIKKSISNIFDNAIKYNQVEGNINITIDDISKNNKNYLRCSIADTGVGIPKDKTEIIFNKFFRANNVVTIDTDGNGLGLFISKTYIENHQGEIWVESKLKKGSKFIFLLPL